MCVTDAPNYAPVTHTRNKGKAVAPSPRPYTKDTPQRAGGLLGEAMLDLNDVPLDVQLLRIEVLAEALETLLSDVWQRHQGDRLLSRAAVMPTATIENGVLIINARPVAIAPTEDLRHQIRQQNAADCLPYVATNQTPQKTPKPTAGKDFGLD